MKNNISTFVCSPKLLRQDIAVILSKIELASSYLQSKQILYQTFESRRRTRLASCETRIQQFGFPIFSLPSTVHTKSSFRIISKAADDAVGKTNFAFADARVAPFARIIYEQEPFSSEITIFRRLSARLNELLSRHGLVLLNGKQCNSSFSLMKETKTDL